MWEFFSNFVAFSQYLNFSKQETEWFRYLLVAFLEYKNYEIYFSGLEIFDMKLRQALYRHITRSAADEDRDLLISMVLPILIRGKHSNKGELWAVQNNYLYLHVP